jgi:hypothetical protein
MSATILLPLQPAAMSGAQLAAVSFLARDCGCTHSLYAYQLREWFSWWQSNGWTPWSGTRELMSSCTSAVWVTAAFLRVAFPIPLATSSGLGA